MQMLLTLLKYKKQIMIVVVVVIVAIIAYLLYKRSGDSTIVVKDDNGNAVSFSAEQKAEAKEIARRINADLNSGWVWGYNVFGSVTRDDEAYTALAQMSDSLFALTCQTYKTDFKSSLITDLRGESSLDGRDYTAAILAKATRLNIA